MLKLGMEENWNIKEIFKGCYLKFDDKCDAYILINYKYCCPCSYEFMELIDNDLKPFWEASNRFNGVCTYCDAPVLIDGMGCDCGKPYIIKLQRISDVKSGKVLLDCPFAVLERRQRRRFYSIRSAENRRERERESKGYHKNEDLIEISKMQKGTCYYCSVPLYDVTGKKSWTLEHLTPLSQGGNKWPFNLALACKGCNQKKHKKHEYEFWKIIEGLHGKEHVKEKLALKASYQKEKLSLSRKRISTKK